MAVARPIESGSEELRFQGTNATVALLLQYEVSQCMHYKRTKKPSGSALTDEQKPFRGR